MPPGIAAEPAPAAGAADQPPGRAGQPPAREGRPDVALPPILAAVSILVFAAVEVLAALIEVTLVPLRVGTAVVPITVLLAAVSNTVVPTLSRRAVPSTAAAIAPALAWIVTVILLSQARPEGDVLMPGSSPLVYVTYALLGVGVISAMVTVVRGQARALLTRADQPVARRQPGQPAPPAPRPVRPDRSKRK